MNKQRLPERTKVPLPTAAAVGVAYFLAAELGHFLSFSGSFATIWPAAGIAMAALALHSPRQWPLFLVTIAIANLTSDIGFHDKNVGISVGFYLANMVEAALAAGMLRWFVFKQAETNSNAARHAAGVAVHRLPETCSTLPRLLLSHSPAVVVFVIGCCTVSTGVGAVIGATVVTQAFGGAMLDNLRIWWGGDAVGMLIVGGPVFGVSASLASWQSEQRDSRESVRRSLILIVVLALVSIAIFGFQSQPIIFAVLPLLVLLALQANHWGSAFGLALIALVAAYFTSRDIGPFAQTNNIPLRATLLQCYFIVLAITVLVFEAILRAKADREEAQQKELQTIVDSLDAMVFMKDTNNVFLRCNVAAARSLSRTPEQIAGCHASELYPDQYQQFERDEREIISTGNAKRRFEETLTLPDGSSMYVETSKIPFRNSIGQISGLITVVNDVTALKRSSEFIEKLFNLSPVPQLLFSDLGVIECNQAALDLFGMTAKEQLLHKFPVQFSPPTQPCGTSSDELGTKHLETAFREGACRFQWTHLKIDQTTVIVDIAMRKVWWESGDALLVSLIDISQQQQYESQLREANRQLESSNQELAQFAHIASHDLKSPLRAISSLAGFVIDDCGDRLPSDSREHLELIRGRIARMGRLLDDLLAYSRVGRTQDAIREIDSRTTWEETVKFSNIPEDVTVEVIGEGVVFSTLDVPLQTCLRNLVSNAVKHRRDGGGRIDLTSDNEGDFVLFSVADDGHGIAPENQERVYRMFETLKSRDEVEGSGMGLALVKKAVDTYGGSIDFESPNEFSGTTFHLRWPKEINIQ